MSDDLMLTEYNSLQNVRIRRLRSNLIMSGRGVTIFGLWMFVRVMILVLQSKDMIAEMAIEASVSTTFAMGFSLALVGIILLFIMIPYMYVSRCAVRDGKGVKRTTLYLFIAAFLAVTTILSYTSDIENMIADPMAYFFTKEEDRITFILIDATMIFAYIDMIYSSIRIRILEKKAA